MSKDIELLEQIKERHRARLRARLRAAKFHVKDAGDLRQWVSAYPLATTAGVVAVTAAVVARTGRSRTSSDASTERRSKPPRFMETAATHVGRVVTTSVATAITTAITTALAAPQIAASDAPASEVDVG